MRGGRGQKTTPGKFHRRQLVLQAASPYSLNILRISLSGILKRKKTRGAQVCFRVMSLWSSTPGPPLTCTRSCRSTLAGRGDQTWLQGFVICCVQEKAWHRLPGVLYRSD